MGGAGTGLPVSPSTPPFLPPGSPVKLGVLAALAAALDALPDLGAVRRWYEMPADPETLTAGELPALYIWDDETPGQDNRLALNELDVTLQIINRLNGTAAADLQAWEEAAETLAGQIHAVLAAPSSLRDAGLIMIRPGAKSVSLFAEGWGQIIINYQLTYAHAWGDASSVNY